MRKVFLLDFETTGIDPKTCRPIEVAIGEYDVTTGSITGEIRSSLMLDSTYPPLSEDIVKLTKITPEELQSGGKAPAEIMRWLCDKFAPSPSGKSSVVVAYNGANFDQILFYAECERHGITPPALVWIDPRKDVQFKISSTCRILSHLVFEHGHNIDITKLHRAAADVELLGMLLSHYDFKDVFRRAVAKKIIVGALVTFEEKTKAKDRGYKWQKIADNDPRTFPKRWIKEIIESELPDEQNACSFQIEVLA